MIQIEDTIVSLDVIEEKFFCNLDSCKGICCVEGDAGAPVEKEELALLQEVLPAIWDDLAPAAKAVIEKQGVVYRDEDGEFVTSIVNGKDCVFTCYDEDRICKCAIEKAYREGKVRFYKPISCHLYPIRVSKFRNFRAVNYHQWDICQAAITLGKAKDVRIYQFLKEPLIRKFGEAWYSQLEFVAKEYLNQQQ